MNYFSQGFFSVKDDNVAGLKKGKDVISRFDYVNDDEYKEIIGKECFNIPKEELKR